MGKDFETNVLNTRVLESGIKQVDKLQISTLKSNEADVSSVSASSERIEKLIVGCGRKVW